MAKDPAFLFYPGDYLRDTQILSEKSQVAYDRIICEHIRNICISKSQLNFLTKKLNDDEKEELYMVLTEVPNGFQIDWVVDSINKRRRYSDSRRNNRNSKKGVKNENTYDNHMEIEIEKENINDNSISLRKEEDRDLNELLLEFNDQVWCESMMMNYKLSETDFEKLKTEFIQDVKLSGEYKEKTIHEVKNHFINLIKKRKRDVPITGESRKDRIARMTIEQINKDNESKLKNIPASGN